jgi:hypothetical protein
MLGSVRPLLSDSLFFFSMKISTRIIRRRDSSSSILPYWLVLVEKGMIKRRKRVQKEKKLECITSLAMVQIEERRSSSRSILPHRLVLVEKEMRKRWKREQKEKKLGCTISFPMVQKEVKSCGSAKNVKKHTEQMRK